MRSKLYIILTLASLCLGLAACGKKAAYEEVKQEENSLVEEVSKEQLPDEEAVASEDEKSIDQEAAEDCDENSVDFELFAGEYCFSSGAGAWSTMITINPDGSFEGQYNDSDMGDIGDSYPDGTVYVSKFEGRFASLDAVDDWTYVASIGCLEVTTETGKEEITDGMRFIYSDSYGFETPDKIEFYLPGKKISELSPDFLTWTGLSYRSIYPASLPYKAFYNIEDEAGFEIVGEEAIAKGEVPTSKEVDVFEIAGSYASEVGTVMNISIYTDMFEGTEIGRIAWDENGEYYQPEASLHTDKNGFKGKADFLGDYSIIITDNTPGKIVFRVYDENGFDCGEYRMTQHFES